MKCFWGTLAALAVAGLAKFEWQYQQNRRALRWTMAWTSYEIGTLADAHAVVDGRISPGDYRQRQDERDKRVQEAIR